MSIAIACHNELFGTAGQLTPHDLTEIAAQGYKSVINNRPDYEEGPEQAQHANIQAEALKLGLNYAFLPVISGAITLEQVQEMARLLQILPTPILAFCRSGARSTNLYQMAVNLNQERG